MIIVHGPRAALGDNKPIFSYLMRLGYILANCVAGIGYMSHYITFMEYQGTKSNLEKLKIMLEELDPVKEAYNIEKLKVFIKMKNDFARWKHRPTDWVIKIRSFELYFMKLYNEWLTNYNKTLQIQGYSSLHNLADGKALGFYYLEEEMRIDKDMRSGWVSMENLIRLRFPDAEKNTNLMILHDCFLNKAIVGDILSCLATDTEAGNPLYTYFYYVATIPNMNTLTEAELRATRIALLDTLTPIQKIIDEWCLLCNDAHDKTDSLLYFIDQLIPVFCKVNDNLQQNVILKFAQDINTTAPHYLFMGEITKEAMLTYYTTMELLTADKRDAMKKIFTEEDEYNRRIPFMFISQFLNPDIPSTKYNKEVISEVMIKRKMIEV